MAKPTAYPNELPWGLTQTQISNLDPLVVLRALLTDAVRRHDRDAAERLAAEICPYQHPAAAPPTA